MDFDLRREESLRLFKAVDGKGGDLDVTMKELKHQLYETRHCGIDPPISCGGFLCASGKIKDQGLMQIADKRKTAQRAQRLQSLQRAIDITAPL